MTLKEKIVRVRAAYQILKPYVKEKEVSEPTFSVSAVKFKLEELTLDQIIERAQRITDEHGAYKHVTDVLLLAKAVQSELHTLRADYEDLEKRVRHLEINRKQ